jgi:uncharacterized protein (TIGR02996 family)
MSDEAAFLRAIQAAPSDVTAKLVYADWLDERGESEKAEYLRLGVEVGNTLWAANHPLRDQIQRRGQLERWLNSAWLGLLRGSGPAADPVALLGLGELRGVLDCYAELSGHAADISYDYHADLEHLSGTVGEMAARRFGPDLSPCRIELLEDWHEALREVLRVWLFRELGQVTVVGTRLAVVTDHGRDHLLACVVKRITDLITPARGWRIEVTPNRDRVFYALDWADLALESADRVLWLHFTFSD